MVESPQDRLMIVSSGKLSWEQVKDWPEFAGRAEIIDGELVLSPAAGTEHQRICTLLGSDIAAFVRRHQLGAFFSTPVQVMLGAHMHCVPDLCFVRRPRLHVVRGECIVGPPDLVIEVISEATRRHDTVVKFREYARREVPEYWLVDAKAREISSWRLEAGEYLLLGRARPSDRVITHVLGGLDVDPSRVLVPAGAAANAGPQVVAPEER